MRDGAPLIERVWYGDSLSARAARIALAPAALLYRSAIAARNAAYDRAWLSAESPPIATISVGNVSAGGTGKTPLAAWIARRLADGGARPAIVLRGYGDDEPLVHAALNPDVPVIVAPDRREGVRRAMDAGATVAVLDDAFQHRRVRRDADIVLVSAEQWRANRLLPAGPLREPLASLSRASVIVVTRKRTSGAEAARVASALESRAPTAVVHLALGELRDVGGSHSRPLDSLRGARVLAVAGIGDPRSFAAQLEAAGARVTLRALGDHHRYTAADVQDLLRAAADTSIIVCTLKDAVKLRKLWTPAPPGLWYVSQRIAVERGGAALDAVLDAVLLRARPASPSSQPSRQHAD